MNTKLRFAENWLKIIFRSFGDYIFPLVVVGGTFYGDARRFRVS